MLLVGAPCGLDYYALGVFVLIAVPPLVTWIAYPFDKRKWERIRRTPAHRGRTAWHSHGHLRLGVWMSRAGDGLPLGWRLGSTCTSEVEPSMTVPAQRTGCVGSVAAFRVRNLSRVPKA
jgi:hypothetical protein